MQFDNMGPDDEPAENGRAGLVRERSTPLPIIICSRGAQKTSNDPAPT
jgi:hypothetical protein